MVHKNGIIEYANSLAFKLLGAKISEKKLLEEFNKHQTYTIIYLDLKGLNETNDVYGHRVGDLILIKVAARLSGAMGHQGLIYRMNRFTRFNR